VSTQATAPVCPLNAGLDVAEAPANSGSATQQREGICTMSEIQSGYRQRAWQVGIVVALLASMRLWISFQLPALAALAIVGAIL
jgi:hypothetical protein